MFDAVTRVELVIAQGEVDADLRLEDCETLEDFEAELASREVRVVDLRTQGRPRIALPLALDALASRAVTCIVASESVAKALARHLRPPVELRATLAPTLELWVGDLVAMRADALVNASNPELRLGGNVSAALQKACGPELQPAMFAKAPISPGGLADTPAFDLQGAGRILHVATNTGLPDEVRQALRSVLSYCDQHHLGSVAIPALGTGSGGLPVARCAAIFAEELRAYAGRTVLKIVAWTEDDGALFQSTLAE